MKKQKLITSIKPEIKAMILEDIEKCKIAKTSRNGSKNFFDNMVAKYSIIDKAFTNNLTIYGNALANVIEYDCRNEIEKIQDKLETYLKSDEIPISSNCNVAEKININIATKVLKNQGIIGSDNLQNNKNKEVNENGKKKISWFKNFTIFKRGK